jgi:tellurite methyltransferase
MTAPAVPPGAVCVRRTPDFSESTIPGGLLHCHSTKPGVWGLIQIIEGSLTYRVLEPTATEAVLTPGHPGVVEPGRLHEVEPRGPVRFFVEFFELRSRDARRGPDQ